MGADILASEAGYQFFGSNESNSTSGEDVYAVPATVYRKIAGSIIFLIIWPFIVLDMKWFPIGRPAAAVLGATFMVIFTVVPPKQAFIVLGEEGNMQTICLLLGMMLLAYYYDREGLLRIAALWIFGRNKPFKRVLWKVCVLSGVLSAIITNDAACLVLTPLLVYEHRNQKRSAKELPPLLLGIATSANIGSASTFFGNPQNAFIAANSEGEVSLLIFFITSLPPAILGMFLSVGFLYLLYFRVVFPKGNQNAAKDAETADPKSKVEHTVIPQDETVFVAGLHESREDLASSYDHSDNPLDSSQAAYERKTLYRTEPRSSSRHSSRYSLRQDSSQDEANSLELTAQSNSHRNPSATRSNSHQNLNNYSATRSNGHQNGYGVTGSNSHPNLNVYGATGNHTSNVPRVTSSETLCILSSASAELPLLQETETSLEFLKNSGTAASEEEEVVNTESIRNRKWQAKLFFIWLIIITIVVVALLAIPPPPTIPSVEFNLGLVPLGAGILTMLVDTILNKKYAHGAITKIDWSILLLFMGLFIWLQGFQNTKFPDIIFRKVFPVMNLARVEGVLLFAVLTIIGSNILSNVPLVILVVSRLFDFPCGASTCRGQLTGVLLAWISTISGNFTLIGSIANLIVAEKGRKCVNYRLTFFEYLRFGFFSTLLALFAGLPLVYFTGKYTDI